MRVRPRLVASASTAVRTTRGSSAGRPVCRCVNARESGPAVDISEHIGDAGVGNHAVEPGGEILGLVGCDRLERRDLHLTILDLHVLQPVRRRFGGDLGQAPAQEDATFSQIFFRRRGRRDGQRSGRAWR